MRDPGGAFTEIRRSRKRSWPEAASKLFGLNRAPLIAPLDEGGHAGAFVVPSAQLPASRTACCTGTAPAWTREPIEVSPRRATEFRVLAIGASSPQTPGCSRSSRRSANAVASYRRQPRVNRWTWPAWRPVAQPGPRAERAAELRVPVEGGSNGAVHGRRTGEPPTAKAQILTVTTKACGSTAARRHAALRRRCSSSPTGTPEPAGEVQRQLVRRAPGAACACTYSCPESLPTGPSRSFAWADPGDPIGFGERVITGLPDGVSLRLEGDAFERVLALGG